MSVQPHMRLGQIHGLIYWEQFIFYHWVDFFHCQQNLVFFECWHYSDSIDLASTELNERVSQQTGNCHIQAAHKYLIHRIRSSNYLLGKGCDFHRQPSLNSYDYELVKGLLLDWVSQRFIGLFLQSHSCCFQASLFKKDQMLYKWCFNLIAL